MNCLFSSIRGGICIVYNSYVRKQYACMYLQVLADYINFGGIVSPLCFLGESFALPIWSDYKWVFLAQNDHEEKPPRNSEPCKAILGDGFSLT